MRAWAVLLGAACVVAAARWLHPMPIAYTGFGPPLGTARELARTGEIMVPNNGWRPATVTLRITTREGAPTRVAVSIDDVATGSCVATSTWQPCDIAVVGPVLYPRLFKLQLAADAPVQIAAVSVREHVLSWHAAGLAVLGGLAGLLLWSVAPSRAGPHTAKIVIWACAAVYLGFLFRTAWLSDDAYITIRTIDNILSGHGARWNIAERVQTYTHPLWMFLLIPARWLAGEPYFAVVTVSIATALAAFFMIVRVGTSAWATLWAALALLFSRAFVEYSTGGLENPLTFLLLGAFYFRYWRQDAPPADAVLVGLGTLLALSRPDAILLVLPALALAWLRTPTWRKRVFALAGLLPLIAWELFSFWYYGSLTPNTAIAKLHTGVPVRELIPHGLAYLEDALQRDPMTLAVGAIAVGAAVRDGTARAWAVVAGIALYYVYIVSIGGDFMAGRFLAAPAYAAALLIARMRLPERRPVAVAAAVTAAILIAGNLGNRGPRDWLRGRPGLTNYAEQRGWLYDERANYYRPLGLLSDAPLPDPAMERGRRARAERHEVPIASAVGMFGFYAGPGVHVLDTLALGDPLLARLYSNRPWSPGHFQRPIPEGYIESLRTGTNQIRDSRMRDFYEIVRTVTRGPLTSVTRLGVTARLAAGRYEALAPKEVVAIDAPEHDSVLAGAFEVAGFAADFSVPNGTGVSRVDVFAYPVTLLSGRPPGGPIALTPVAHGLPRERIARAFGPRFLNVGYAVAVPGGRLEPGTYDIAAFARNEVSGFFNARSIRIQVR